MMIGGTDLVLEGRPDASDFDRAARVLRVLWPNAVVEVPPKYEGIHITNPSLYPFRLWDEIFFYRDEETRISWKEEGLTESNAGGVIWISVDEDALCFVVDAPSSEAGRIASDIIATIETSRRHDGWENAA